MDQVSNRSGVGSDDITDESASLADFRLSSDEDSSDTQGPCLAVPQAPLQSYKLRLEEFKKLFKEIPEMLILDYPCALHRDILLQGRLYLSENWICFYSNVFRGTKIILNLKDITTMSREKTARFIPNAIQICTNTEKLFFTSFSAREKSFKVVFSMWQNTLSNKSLSCQELWQMVKQHYGYDLGLSNEEMESLQVSAEVNMQTSSPPLKAGNEDGSSRLERPHSLRLPVVEHGPLGSSTPQGEDLPSPFNPLKTNTDEVRNTPSQRRNTVLPLDRLAPDRISKRSSNSLDLNANENGVSEHSGSESMEEVEDRISQPEALGRLNLNKVFNLSANKMFDLLFTDSSFTRRFMSIRKITNVSSDAWQKDGSGNMKRTLNYTIAINNPLIGKYSAVTETQTLYKESRDGQYYLLDSEVFTHDVPYHDYFYTITRYYIVSLSKRKCRLRVYTDVKYRKPTWGLVKSFITKNSYSAIEDNFRQLEVELLEEEAEVNQAGGESGKMSGLRRRRRTYSRTLQDHIKPNKQYGPDLEPRDGTMGPIEMTDPYRLNTATIVAVMSVILLTLVVLNLGLFFKLWAMEDVAHRMYLTTKHRLKDRLEARLTPEYDPQRGPGYGTNEDMHLLKTVLQDSINLLEQLRSSLMVLQNSFALANETATPQ